MSEIDDLPNDDSLRQAKRIDELCDAFETQCQAGARPRIEDFLLQIDVASRQALLLELIALDIHFRRGRGETVASLDYQERFPGLSAARLESLHLGHLDRTSKPFDSPGSDGPTIDSGGATKIAPGSTMVKYFGDYELLSVIARGGMGVVYKARQISLHRIVALKMILSGEFASPDEVQRFYSEAKAAALLDHPGIVSIFEVGEHNGQHFFSMTYVEGSSLAAKLNQGPLEPIEAARLIREVAQAVQYAHEQGVIHRDLKPSNILLDLLDRPRVTDFGLAKRMSQDQGLTLSGQILGTPSYMPPEQAAGKINVVGAASDVYALGAVLYSMLTGRPPFQAASSIETLHQVVELEPAAPSQLNPSVPRDLETIVLKCLEKSLPRRYGTAKLLAEELDRFIDGKPILARPVGRFERAWRWCRREPMVASLLFAVALALTAGAGVSSYFAYMERQRAISEASARQNETQQRLKAEQQTAIAEEQTRVAEAAQLEEANQTVIAKQKSRELRQSLYLSDINRIPTYIEEKNIARVRELLDRQIPATSEDEDLRGFDWYYWWQQVNPDIEVFDLKLPIEKMAASSDESLISLGCTGGRVYLFDVAKECLLDEVYKIDEEHFSKLAFADRDRRLFAFGFGGSFKVWDRSNRKLVVAKKFGDTTDGLLNMQSTRQRIETRIWDTKTGLETLVCNNHSIRCCCVAFSPDGKQIATAGIDGMVHLKDAANGNTLLRLKGHHGGITDLAFRFDAQQLVTAKS